MGIEQGSCNSSILPTPGHLNARGFGLSEFTYLGYLGSHLDIPPGISPGRLIILNQWDLFHCRLCRYMTMSRFLSDSSLTLKRPKFSACAVPLLQTHFSAQTLWIWAQTPREGHLIPKNTFGSPLKDSSLTVSSVISSTNTTRHPNPAWSLSDLFSTRPENECI